MVIVEGPDGSGKSTLVQRLSDALGVEVMPRPCKSDTAVEGVDLRAWIDDDLRGKQKGSGLYDRYPLVSELVYGPAVRGKLPDNFGLSWLTSVLGKLHIVRKPVLIFCLPPWENVKENVEASHDPTTEHLQGVLKNLRMIYDLYKARAALYAGLTPRAIVWDYTLQGSPFGDEYYDIILSSAREHIN